MKEFNKYKNILNEIDYYVYALCEVNGTRRIPFYIGKGKNSRCLTHIAEAEKMKKSGDKLDEKTQKIIDLAENSSRSPITQKACSKEKTTCSPFIS